MKILKLVVFAPNNEKLITEIIKAASDAGAARMGNYTETAFVSVGMGRWKSGNGSNPHIGEVGKLTKQEEARIEMRCREDLAKKVELAIREVHPYEEPAIEFYDILDI